MGGTGRYTYILECRKGTENTSLEREIVTKQISQYFSANDKNERDTEPADTLAIT
jgi:hypothetical protein